MKKHLFIIFVILFCNSILIPLSRAQDSPYTETNLSFNECLEMALSDNKEVLKAEEKIRQSRAKIWQGYSGFLPNVSVGGLYTHLNEEPPKMDLSSLMSPSPQVPDISGNPLLQYKYQDNYSGYLRVDVPIFMGGRNYSTLQIAKTELEINREQEQLIKSKVYVDVIRSFYGLLVSREMKVLTEDMIKQIERRIIMISNFVSAGTATEYDLLKVKVQLSLWSSRLINIEKNLNNSKNLLQIITGLPQTQKFRVQGTLEQETNQICALDEAKIKTLQARSEILIARNAYKLSQKTTQLKSSAYFPQVMFQYNYNLQNQEKNFSLQQENWMNWWDIRLILSWEVFSFGRTRAQVKESQHLEEEKKLDAELTEENILMQVEGAYYSVQEMKRSVETAKKSLELAQLEYQMAQDKNQAGTITEVEFLDSFLNMADAKVQYLKSLYDYKISYSEFLQLTGMINL